MPDTYDVVIVGGGAIGAACARELACTGRTVLLLDSSGPAGQGWRTAAGMLAPQIEAQADDALFRLALAGRDSYAPLAAALHERTGTDIGLWQGGILLAGITGAVIARLLGGGPVPYDLSPFSPARFD